MDFQRCVNDGIDDDGFFAGGRPYADIGGLHRPEMDAELQQILNDA